MRTERIIAFVRAQWLILLAGVLVGVLAATAYLVARPNSYTSTTILYVAAQPGNSATAAYDSSLLSQDRVASYRSLVTSERVLGGVIRQLGLPESIQDLQSSVVATSQPDSILIDVAVTDANPDRSALIANTIGDTVTQVVDDLERPSTPGGVQPVSVKTVQRAEAPSAPSSVDAATVLIIGLLAGLLTGISVAYWRAMSDTSLKDVDALSGVIGAPALGLTYYDRSDTALTSVLAEGQTPQAEAYRQLRTGLQFLDVDSDLKVILLTSALPTEGKTRTAINLAAALAAAGERVVLIDADLRRPAVARNLGLEANVGLTSVLAGRVAIPGAVQYSAGRFDVLTSGPIPPNPSELLSSRQMRTLLGTLTEKYDHVLIDSPPLLPVTDSQALSASVDGTVLVCRYRATKAQQVRKAKDAVDLVSGRVVGGILTMVSKTDVKTYGGYYYHTDRPGQPTPIDGTIPADAERESSPGDDDVTRPRNAWRPAPTPRG